MGELDENIFLFSSSFYLVKIMKKNRFIRISKRVMVLLLCCSLVSGACFNKYKVTANAAAMTATLGSYAAYEICLYIGGLLLAGSGLAAAYDNRDKIAEVGKNFIDSMNLDEVSGWLLTKVNTAGQSYVYGTEALKEIQDTGFSVIQGGGNKPENDDDHDGDGDSDVDDRTIELDEMGLWATSLCMGLIEEGIKPLIEGIKNGEENILTSAFDLGLYSFDQYDVDSSGNYILNIMVHKSDSVGNVFDANCRSYILSGYFLPCIYLESRSDGTVNLNYIATKVDRNGELFRLLVPFEYKSVSWVGDIKTGNLDESSRICDIYSANIPIFGSLEAALAYLKSGDSSDCLNKSKVYQIADWLQEHWASALEQLNTGIRSLNDNMLIVGAAANAALNNQANGLGYIEDLAALIAAATPLPLPGTVADPIYYPIDSPVAPLDPGDYPWVDPVPVPDPEPDPVPDPTPEPGEDVVIGDYAIDLRKLFPFCIPFDFIALLRVLDAEPEAPRFEIPFVIPMLGIDITYEIDLSMFNDAMEVIRLFELVSFVIGLMLLTGKVIKW